MHTYILGNENTGETFVYIFSRRQRNK